MKVTKAVKYDMVSSNSRSRSPIRPSEAGIINPKLHLDNF